MNAEAPNEPPLSADQVDDLVAYLDGELDEEQTESVEQNLARDPEMQREVDLLTRTWDMLELLPAEKASDNFTEKTLASIRVETEQNDVTQRMWFHRTRRGFAVAGWIAGLSIASMVGFLATNRWTPDESAPLLDDLPVIESLDVYSEADSVEFLEELRASGLLDEEITDVEP